MQIKHTVDGSVFNKRQIGIFLKRYTAQSCEHCEVSIEDTAEYFREVPYIEASDVVEIITFETETKTWLKFRDKTETSPKTPRPRLRLETWSSRPRLETSNFVHFAKFFEKILSSLLTWKFFKFLAFLRRVLVVFPANTTNKKSLNYRNLNKTFLCNIRSLETWNLRDRDRDSQKWVSRLVSRPRPSLETPSLIEAVTFFIKGQENMSYSEASILLNVSPTTYNDCVRCDNLC